MITAYTLHDVHRMKGRNEQKIHVLIQQSKLIFPRKASHFNHSIFTKWLIFSMEATSINLNWVAFDGKQNWTEFN